MRRSLPGLLCVLALGLSCTSTAAAEIEGEWWTPGFNSRVKIGTCGESLCGVIVWLWEETPHDKIADKQPLVGRQLFVDLKATRPGAASGRVYNPEDGHLYRANIELKAANTLELQGCFLFICTRQLWRRVDPTTCPPVARKDALLP